MAKSTLSKDEAKCREPIGPVGGQPTRRIPIDPNDMDGEGYKVPRWGGVSMDDAVCSDLYGKMPVPPRKGECESPKRLSGSNRTSGR